MSQEFNVKPLHDRVIIKATPAEEKIGSIIIPDTAKEKPQKGEVIAFGDKATSIVLGDIVLYGKYAGTEIQVNGQNLLIMRESDILAII